MPIHLPQNKDKVPYHYHFSDPTYLLRLTVHQLLSALFHLSQTGLLSVASCSLSPYSAFAYAVLSAWNPISSSFHPVTTCSSLRSLLRHHFFREAFLDFPLLGQMSLIVSPCSPHCNGNFIFIYTSLFTSNCPTRVKFHENREHICSSLVTQCLAESLAHSKGPGT